jgi:hypothetical protein
MSNRVTYLYGLNISFPKVVFSLFIIQSSPFSINIQVSYLQNDSVTFLKRPLVAGDVTRVLDGEKRLRFLATEGRTVCMEGLRKDMAKPSRARCKKQIELNLDNHSIGTSDIFSKSRLRIHIVVLSIKKIVFHFSHPSQRKK